MPNILYTIHKHVRIFTVACRAALVLRLIGVRTCQCRTHDRVTDNRLLLAHAGKAGVVMRCPAWAVSVTFTFEETRQRIFLEGIWVTYEHHVIKLRFIHYGFSSRPLLTAVSYMDLRGREGSRFSCTVCVCVCLFVCLFVFMCILTLPRISPRGFILVLTWMKAVPLSKCCNSSTLRSFKTPWAWKERVREGERS